MSKQHKPGGGPASRVNVSPSYRHGQPARRKNEKAVSQIGSAMGDHTTSHSRSLPRDGVVEKGDKGVLRGVGSTELGNKNSERLSGANAGCGTGRTIYERGTQAMQGAANPGRAPERRDILSQFGPDVPGRR